MSMIRNLGGMDRIEPRSCVRADHSSESLRPTERAGLNPSERKPISKKQQLMRR